MEIGQVVRVVGQHADMRIIEFGVSPGLTLSDGYVEPDWHWVRLERADGSYPDFNTRVSVSDIRAT